MKFQAGETISQYRIVEEIGQGGMGIVFRAEDTKLRRMVALKFLPWDLSRDTEARDRFAQEAQAASALQHNNICTIHDIDRTADGQMFIVMDLYTGETLKQKLSRGRLPTEEAIDIAMQIGQGLERAHGRGIVHRDVKPANIFITEDGTVKILDFGLAKLGTGTNLTKAGTTLGTAAYMSPEQTRGDEVDARTDIWSLGVVLYQMLAGELPFSAGHELALMYAIQNSNPAPLAVPSIPEKCRQILAKALQKRPDDRYQHVRELVSDLRKLESETGSGRAPVDLHVRSDGRRNVLYSGIIVAVIVLLVASFFLFRQHSTPAGASSTETQALHRLAVLPLTNLRNDPETDFLGFALADQIIGNLSYLKNLVVRPSSVIRVYQNRNIEPAVAGKDLNVDLILTGNYLKEGNIIRLTLELADIHSDAIVWRGTMQEEYENVFRLEDTVASKVVEGLRITFSPEEIHEMQADVSRNPLAYDYYLRALSYPVTLEGNNKAVSMLRQSIALDSLYAPAFEHLGYRLAQLVSYAGGQNYLAGEAESALLKALSLNGQMLSAYGGLASMYTEAGRTEEAYETVQKTLAINPNSPESHFALGYICRYAGFIKRAMQEMEKALALDPKNPRFRSIGITYVYAGQYQKALSGFDLDSASSFSHSWKAHTYLLMGEPERALPHVNHVLEIEPNSRLGLFCEEMKIYVDKDYDHLAETIRRSEAVMTIDGESWYNLAEQLGRFGRAPDVARILHNAIDRGFFNYPMMLMDPLLESVRADREVQSAIATAKPRYEDFKRRHPELAEEQ